MVRKDIKGLQAKYVELADKLAFVDPEELKEYIKGWSGGFHRYSLNNYLLAAMQRKEGISVLAGYRKWQAEGRQVIKGQKALTILGPRTFKKEDKNGDEETGIYFRPVNVFDIGQTGVVREFDNPITGEHFHILDTEDKMLQMGGGKNVKNSGELTMDTVISKSDIPIEITAVAALSDGKTNGKKIWIEKRSNEAGMIAAGFHELGHVKASHFGKELSREVEEIEAEAISYLVCSYFGIDNPDAVLYIHNWKGDRKTLEGRGKNVINAVEQIIDLFEEKEEANSK